MTAKINYLCLFDFDLPQVFQGYEIKSKINNYFFMSKINTLDIDNIGLSNPLLYNTFDLAKLLKVSTRTINRWKSQGTIRFSAVGSKHYFMHDDVIEMLNSHKINC